MSFHTQADPRAAAAPRMLLYQLDTLEPPDSAAYIDDLAVAGSHPA